MSATVSANPIVMPKLGLTMSEGLVAEWLVGVGDTVAPGQTIFVVETDKISHEIEAPASGKIVALLAAKGDTVPVGDVVATWTGPGQSGANAEACNTAPPIGGEINASAPMRRSATPLARRLASQWLIDLAAVTPSGDRGRIKARDIEHVHAQRARTQPAVEPARSTSVPATALRKLIARKLTRSKSEIPHFYATMEADITRLDRLRAELNDESGRPKLSFTPFLIAAIGRAMAARRDLNALWRDGSEMRLDEIAVGFAVHTDTGVHMPVIRGADHRPIDELAAAIKDAAGRSRSGRLREADLGQAAISLSNAGMFGVSSLTPIIDPDQSFIIGVGAAKGVFRPSEGNLPVLRREVTLTLAADHRLIDGAAGAALIGAVAALLESPLRLLRS